MAKKLGKLFTLAVTAGTAAAAAYYYLQNKKAGLSSMNPIIDHMIDNGVLL